MEDFSSESSLQAHFAPILEVLERERRSIVDRNYTIMCIAFGLVLGGGLLTFEFENPAFIGISIFLGLFVYFAFADKGAKEWAIKYKNDIINAIVLSFFGENGSYQPNYGHTEEEFLDTELFDTEPDRFHSEDFIKGKVDKTLFCFSEVHAEYKTTSSKGKTSWHTIFKGILFTADFNKDFQGRTIVKQNDFWAFLKFGNIELENPEFRKEFGVWATDPIEARYILTPSFMEKMLLLNKNWGGSLGFCFVRSQLKIAIPMQTNFFEVSVWSKIDAQREWQKDWQIIADLISVVHDLDLNTRIWTKE